MFRVCHSLRDRLSRAFPSFLLSCRMWLSSSKSRLSLQSQDGYSIDRGTEHHKHTILSDLLKAPQIKIIWFFLVCLITINPTKLSKNKNRKKTTILWFDHHSFMHICPNRTLETTAWWSGIKTLAEKSTYLFQKHRAHWMKARGQCLSVSLINIQNNSNRSRKWPTYCTDILPDVLTASLSLYMMVNSSLDSDIIYTKGRVTFCYRRGTICSSSAFNVPML